MNEVLHRSKVPEITLIFWLIKILATTLGETGGDAVSMSMDLGYALSSVIFIGIFVAAVAVQISARAFYPPLYWFVVVATTTAGTTMADFADRSLGIGYSGGALLLIVLLMSSLAVWYRSEGSISVNEISTTRVETFYWMSILFSQTLGTALGDWMADTNGLGYEGGALVFSIGLAVIAARLFLDQHLQDGAVLVRFHSHAPVGRDAGRFARQADEGWRPCLQPILCDGAARRGHSCVRAAAAPARRLACGRTGRVAFVSGLFSARTR